LTDDEDDLEIEISRIIVRLSSTMARMEERLKRNDDSRIRNAVKALASAQGQLLKALFQLDSRFHIPLVTGETWNHYYAKNWLVKKLSLEDISAEVRIGDCIFDAVGRIGEEYVIIEAETKPTKCMAKVEKITKAIDDFVSGKIEILEESNDSIFLKIKKQLAMGKPMRLVFAVTGKRKPNQSTLRDIRKAEGSLIRPEVYYINSASASLEISPNLLQEI